MSTAESRDWRGCHDAPGWAQQLRIDQALARFVLALVMLLDFGPDHPPLHGPCEVEFPGPWIYVQKRLGLGGKVFTIYKIRTMYDGQRASLRPDLVRPR